MTNGIKHVEYGEGRSFLSPTDEIIEDMRNGRMVVLVDAEDRENEGDLVIPGADGDAGRRQLHGAVRTRADLPDADAAAGERVCGLSPWCARTHRGRARRSRCQSKRAMGSQTGISAHDRARTIAAAIDPTKDHASIVSPGHVFPLIAREGGVLIRAGHTEASVDLAKLQDSIRRR